MGRGGIEHARIPSATQQAFGAMSAMAHDRSIAEGLVLELRGPLSTSALRTAVTHLERRHPEWRRMAFDDSMVWSLADVERAARPDHDASGSWDVDRAARGDLLEELDLSGPDARARLIDVARRRVTEPFDLRTGPLVRFTLARLGEQQHALVVVMHHAVTDGTTLFVELPRQLEALYRSVVADRGDASIARDERLERLERPERLERRPGDAEDAARAFWQRELESAPRSLDLPTDHRRPLVRTFRGARIESELTRLERDTLFEVARASGARPVDVCLAALALLCARLSKASEVVLATAHANRRDPADAHRLGCLIVNVPIVCEVGASASFDELVARVRSRRRMAFRHLSPVVDEVVAGLDVEPGRNPGYQVALNYMPFSERSLTFADLEVTAWRPDPEWTGTDLAVDVIEDPDGLRIVLERDVSAFDEVTVRAWLDALVSLLRRVTELRTMAIDEIQLVDEHARAQLVALGDGGGPPARVVCLHDVVYEGVRAAPDGVALVHRGRTWTHSDVWKRACGLAHRLAATPGVRGGLVGLVLTEPPNAVVSMLGTLLAGAAYVPLDPALPPTRIARKLEDARPAVLVTEGPTSITGVPVVVLEEDTRDEPPVLEIDPNDPAYVIFTSGSTGRPKGVVVRHRNVVHQLDARRAIYESAPQRTMVAHSFAFDSAVGNLYWALANGGTLVLLDEDERRDPELLRRSIHERDVELLDVPPALYHELLREGAHGLESLRVVVVGGEAVAPSLTRLHRELLPNVRLIDEYGPTETTVFSTAHEVRAHHDDSVPIGRPIHRTRCYVVDDRGELALRGAIGELWIGGDGVTAGYLRRDGATRERFVELRGERVYRTGDRVRWSSTGELAFHGRADQQVQVRGHRVELDEIVSVLESKQGVERAVVVARERGGITVLDGYLVGRAIDPNALRAALEAELPTVMIPSTLTVVASLPRAVSGKIDTALLPPPTPPAPSPRATWRSDPRNQTEDRIAHAFRRALNLETVGVYDSFFDLGGSSLTAVRVLATLQRELDVRVPLEVFVRAPTVAGLAERLLESGTLAEERLVVELRAGAPDREPFWLVHPVGGHVVFGHRIAERWSPEQPLYGIQARGLDGRHPPIRDMAQMAELYVELIRGQQPRGPYYLGGPSQGGLIALEVAQRLLRRGEEVAMLVMFDCWAPGWPRYRGRLRKLLDHLVDLRAMAWRERRAYVRERLDRRLRGSGASWMRYDGAEQLEASDIRDALLEVQRANEQLADAYVPSPYPGVIHVFQAMHKFRSPGYDFDDPTCGWNEYAREVVADVVDAAHHEMLDPPSVFEVAAKLERHLEAVRAARRAHETREPLGVGVDGAQPRSRTGSHA